jgi:hypothetical protein
MKHIKLGLLTLTICFLISFPIIAFGFDIPYTNASENIDVENVREIVFKFDSEEIKNTFDLNLVTVIINGSPRKVLTNRVEIDRLLKDMGIVNNNSKKILSTTENIQNGSVVRVITVGTVVEENSIEIPYRTEKVNTKEIAYGDTKVVQKGVLGVRTQQVKKTYEDGKLVQEKVLSEEITREPVKEIVKVGVLKYSPNDLDRRYGYNCSHWYSVVDESNYTDQEKQWLKYVMECESGCNAESDKNSTYKGLFQWNPRYWDIFFPGDNIYDGYAQIENTIWKIRNGVNLYAYWPHCHRAYVREFGEFTR